MKKILSKPQWWMFPVMILITIPCMIIDSYSSSKWFCNFWGWHKSPNYQGFDGCSFTGTCRRCGKEVLQDGQVIGFNL